MPEEESKIEGPEKWTAIVEERVEELLELVKGEGDFFKVGDRYGLEQFLFDESQWSSLGDSDKRWFLEEIGKTLGVDLIGYSREAIVRQYREEGISGEPSEGGASVDVLATNDPQLEIHVMDYVNPDLGIRYDLVRKE